MRIPTRCTFGSSPRVRGKRATTALARLKGRLIPACAGKTPGNAPNGPLQGAHLRVCGENRAWTKAAERARGSSPRVRGKHPHARDRGRQHRLIPACAGKTPPASSPQSASRAHPRVCGENVHGPLDPLPASGSSPRVRGKPVVDIIQRFTSRLIPACAGKTSRTKESSSGRGAHPRVCGENPCMSRIRRRRFGSSPRVRGKRSDCDSI